MFFVHSKMQIYSGVFEFFLFEEGFQKALYNFMMD